MKVIAVIPARIGSTRLARKPLIEIAGKPMIQHVYDNLDSPYIHKKIIATDSPEIASVAQKWDAEVMLTSPDHQNGTERCGEVISHHVSYDLVLNIQGDEPMVNNRIVEQLVTPFLKHPQLKLSTLKRNITDIEAKDSNVVKVVTDKQGYALYFSRSTIPFNRDQDTNLVNRYDNTSSNSHFLPYFKHLGFYAFKRKFLLDYLKMPVCPLETIEKLEQLRVLYYGEKIYVNETEENLIDINTQADIEKFKNYLKQS